VTSAFFYLAVCSAKNRIRQRFRRLRRPRYLAGFAAAVLYMYFFVFRHAFEGAGRPERTPFGGLENASEGLAFVGPILMWGAVTLAWVMPGSGAAIPFSRSEVQFLFPAPLTRRQLLHYKLVRGQVGPLIGTAVMTLLLRPSTVLQGWMFFAGTWLVLSALRMHFLGVALRRQSLAQHGAPGVRRHWLPVSIVAAAAFVMIVTVALDWPRLSALATGGEVAAEIRRLLAIAPASWILWPFGVLAQLPLAPSPQAFVQALPIVGVILALNYFWVVRGDVAFEEASAAQSERLADERARQSVVRRDVRRQPFPLALRGPVEVALLWKNLILCGRLASWLFLLRFIPLMVIAAVAIARTSSAGVVESVTIMCLGIAALTVVIGPQSLRCDMRQDLAHFQLLKAWPVRGAALLRGELLAPTVVLTVVTWMLILIAVIFTWTGIGHPRMPPPIREHRLALAGAAALIAPAFIVAQLILHNGIAVMFPAWVAIGASRSRGIDAMGQRLLMMAGVVLVLLVAVLPAALVAVPVVLAVETILGDHGVAIVAAALVVATVIFVESWFATARLGRVFERTDATDLEPTE
jgi:ABC-2 type transport system permease protein